MKCKLAGVSKSYNDRIILDHIDYDFSTNGMYVICGKSGSGKTTLLNIIAGYENADKGFVEAAGAQVVYALQNYELLENLNISENLEACLSFHPNTFLDPVDYMKYVKVDHLQNHYPRELSKGQKQRIMIIKALCRKANIYLFDEPTSALDSESAKLVMDLLYEKAKKAVVIVVTHDLSQVIKEKTTLLVMKDKRLIEIYGNKEKDNDPSIKYEPSEAVSIKAKSFINGIYKKQNNKTMFYYLLFSIVIIAMFFINDKQYQWKIYDDLYEKDYLYIKDSTQYNRTMQDHDSLINFLAFDTGTNSLPIHAVSVHDNKDQALLKDGGIIINQNTAKFFVKHWGKDEQDLIGMRFYLEYIDGSATKQIAFQIRRIIVEQDARTSAMAYYDINDLKNRIENYEEIETILYEEKVTAADIETVYREREDEGKEVFHPMLSDKYAMIEQGYSEGIILWLFIAVISIFYLIFIYVIQQNNWRFHLMNQIILINDGISCDDVKKYYIRSARLRMLSVTGISLLACVICSILNRSYLYLFAAILMIVAYLFNNACINRNCQCLQRHQIVNLLKEAQEIN